MSSCHNPTPPALCLTIGNFDGVHLGHRFLIDNAAKIAKNSGLDFGIMTFWPHPRSVLLGARNHLPLTTRAGRLKLLEETGAARILELPFDLEFASLAPETFLDRYLKPLDVKKLVIGHDFTLGHNRSGTESILRGLGSKFDMEIIRTPAFAIDGKPVSSTRLREAIRNGDLDLAASMLGRNYLIEGSIAHGMARGAKIGFPTANLEDIEVMLPHCGVYATIAIHKETRYPAVTNIGMNPTFNNSELTVETFLLDANVNLYGEELALEFIRYLRPERKFLSPAHLAAQIAQDVETARAILPPAP